MIIQSYQRVIAETYLPNGIRVGPIKMQIIPDEFGSYTIENLGSRDHLWGLKKEERASDYLLHTKCS